MFIGGGTRPRGPESFDRHCDALIAGISVGVGGADGDPVAAGAQGSSRRGESLFWRIEDSIRSGGGLPVPAAINLVADVDDGGGGIGSLAGNGDLVGVDGGFEVANDGGGV